MLTMRVPYILALLLAVAKAGQNTKPQAAQYTGYRPSPRISASQPTGSSYTAPIGGKYSSLDGNFVDDLFRGSGYGDKRGAAAPYARSHEGGGYGQFGGGDIWGSQTFGASRGGKNIGSSHGGNNFDVGGQFQRGKAQVSSLDSAADKLDRNHEQYARDFAAQEQGAGRRDNQERKGQLSKGESEKQQKKESSKGSKKKDSYKQESGVWNQDLKRQNGQQSHVGTLNRNDGELLRSDVDSSDGSKALGVRKTAYINGNLGFENVGYNFDKDFDQKANERGGYKEVTGRDDNNIKIYQEKQRSHKLTDSNNEAFRKADDSSKSSKSNNWLQNALQKQDQDKNYGAADKLKDSAAKQAADFKTFFDRRDDSIWNAALSRDTAYRGAQDNAAKNGQYNKDALAWASGHKGVADRKFYDGAETGPKSRGAGLKTGYTPVGHSAPGINDYAPQATGKWGNEGYIGAHGGGGGHVAGVAGPSGNVKGRSEASGGDVRNRNSEKAVQGDLGNQLWKNTAESKANAKNNYHRDRGLEDSIQLDQANQGKWANQREGFRDGRRQGYNGDRAKASRGGDAVDNSFSSSLSSSNLDSADRGLDKATLDRINLKRNQVDSKQNVRSKKQFYHDKNQGGWNNEGLKYHKNRGNNDFGAQEAAETESKTKHSNLHQDSKNSRGQRHFEDQDSRKISNADAAYKRQKSGNGNAAAFSLANERAKLQGRGFDRNLARKEFDRFQQQNNQQNHKNWDRVNHDIFGRSGSNNIGRRVDGNFLYRNDENPKSSVGYSSSGNRLSPLGKATFGSVPLGKVEGGYEPFPSQGRQAKQPQSNSAHPIGNVGAGFGQTQFGQYW